MDELKLAQEKLLHRNESEERELKELRDSLRTLSERFQTLGEEEHTLSISLNTAELSKKSCAKRRTNLNRSSRRSEASAGKYDQP